MIHNRGLFLFHWKIILNTRMSRIFNEQKMSVRYAGKVANLLASMIDD